MVCAPVQRDNPQALESGSSTIHACTMIYSVELAQYRVSYAKDLAIFLGGGWGGGGILWYK